MKSPIKSRSDIPNQAGFNLLLVRADGSEQLARVVKGADGCHYCATLSGTKVSLNQSEANPVAGWRDYVAPTGPSIPGMICNRSPGLYTRHHTRSTLALWGVTENPPAKGKAVFVNFAPGADFPLVVVNVWPNKSSEGETLFAVWLYRWAGVDLSNAGPYATREDKEIARDCGVSVEQLRLDRAKEDIPAMKA